MLRMWRGASIALVSGTVLIGTPSYATEAGRAAATAAGLQAIAVCNQGAWQQAADQFAIAGGTGATRSFPAYPNVCAPAEAKKKKKKKKKPAETLSPGQSFDVPPHRSRASNIRAYFAALAGH